MQDRVRAIHASLVDEHGEPVPPRDVAPLVALVGTILSQHTSDVNCDKALDKLEAEIGLEPEQIRSALVEEPAEAIRPAGLANQTAEPIHALLDRLDKRPDGYSLASLDEMDADEAREWLTSVPVGPETAAVQLLFRFDKPVFPVDTQLQGRRQAPRADRRGRRLPAGPPPDGGPRP
jgi:endonuclease-3